MSFSPGNLPFPPSSLAWKRLPVRVLDAGAPWHRIFNTAFGPVFFGKSGYRFDDPKALYGVLYAGLQKEAAFAETICRNPGSGPMVTMPTLRQRSWVTLRCRRALRLVDLTGDLVTLQADARLWSGDYGPAQAWSRAFYEHPDTVDGLLYPSRHAQTRVCVALYDRVTAEIDATIGATLADDTRELGRLLDLFDVALAPER
jgi:hypothetical protein